MISYKKLGSSLALALAVFGYMCTYACTPEPSLDRIQKLFPGQDCEVVWTDWQLTRGYSRKWLLEFRETSIVDGLLLRARKQGVNLSVTDHVISRAILSCPERFKGRFSGNSQFVGMFFLGAVRHRRVYLNIVVSTDRHLVYVHETMP